MTELLTAAQMRAVEAAAIASGQVTGLELMERAGRGVVEAIFEEWPELAPPPGALPSQASVDWGPAPRPPEYLRQDEGTACETRHRAVVLCGPGNNGGDGFVVARLLKEWGWEVEVFLYGDPGRLPPDARVNYERWCAMGEVEPLRSEVSGDFPSRFPLHLEPEIVLDALFGTGLSRPLDPGLRLALGQLSSVFPARFTRWVAVDIVSGLCADSGRFLGTEAAEDFRSYDMTVTFHVAKLGHYLGNRQAKGGRLVVKDIGLARSSLVLAQAGTAPGSDERRARMRKIVRLETGTWQVFKDVDENKYSHGHAFVLSGGAGRGGAARLAARGALRIGAGVVTVGCPPEAISENAARLDAVMLRGVADGAALAGVLEDKRINALCLGPGMGTGEREAGLVGVALGLPVPGLTRDLVQSEAPRGKRGPGSSPGRGLVLDADALTILSHRPDLFAALQGACVLTPHAGEFARLFPDIAENLAAPATKGPAYSKVDATREAAARAGCVVLYKGPDTVIAAPDGRCAINAAAYDRAAPWLATAGSGDVLAGFITGLLARGFSPFDAACSGAWLHVECALSFGPGLIAEDLAEELPKVFRALGL
jgi:hydroxyethylthiazole kinase-like uncharacterized protein yjeF